MDIMRMHRTSIPEICTIENFIARDNRGYFEKIYNAEVYQSLGIPEVITEVFFSSSAKNVIRGMHYQSPPYDMAKIIHVVRGAIIDVVLDIRGGSPSFGSYVELELSERDNNSIYIPTGFAHGFLSLTNDTIVCYLQSRGFVGEADAGIHYLSFGKEWGVDTAIVSRKDQCLPNFQGFETPFIYCEE
jgi:dTDP-4-dehydrorhamnose 3,5-epimerase/CDP-3, 6-dideoxy-D-glycero-D-glycero-4-hexulose-5-epimerase